MSPIAYKEAVRVAEENLRQVKLSGLVPGSVWWNPAENYGKYYRVLTISDALNDNNDRMVHFEFDTKNGVESASKDAWAFVNSYQYIKLSLSR